MGVVVSVNVDDFLGEVSTGFSTGMGMVLDADVCEVSTGFSTGMGVVVSVNVGEVSTGLDADPDCCLILSCVKIPSFIIYVNIYTSSII